MKRFSEWSAIRENEGLAQMTSSGNAPIAGGTGTQQMGSNVPEVKLGAATAPYKKFIDLLKTMQPPQAKALLANFMHEYMSKSNVGNNTVKKIIMDAMADADAKTTAKPGDNTGAAQSQEPQAGGAAQNIQQPPSQPSAKKI